MSPELVARAKRERQARDFRLDLVNLARSWFWYVRHPTGAVFVTRLRLHYEFGFAYPSPPRWMSQARIRV